MNILQKLTKKDLKLNKKRTMGTLIGIILSTALITVVGGMAITLQNTLVEGEKNNTGYYHIQLSDIKKTETEKIKLNKDYSHYEIVNDLGIAKEETEDTTRYPHLYSMSKETSDYLKTKIIKGNFPKDQTEVLVGEAIINSFNYKIGDVIEINPGTVEEKEIDPETTEIINPKHYKFTISGIIRNYDEMITTNVESEKLDMYLTLKNPKHYKKDFEELLGKDPYNKEESEKIEYDYYINRDLLHWEVGSFGDETLKILYTMVAIVITIILITSIFSIRNSFAISTTEKIKTYGMLSSVGATKKQIREMVLYEGRTLGLIGITIGCILGTLITFLLTNIINIIASGAELFAEGWMFIYKFSIIPIIFAAIIGIIMIFLSTITCAIKASKVSPIQNLRNADNLKSKKIKLKTPKYIKKIFNIGGVLSYKNLKRSKRKYRVTIISLTVSIFVFITISSFIEYGLKIVKTQYMDVSYNISVQPKRNNKYELINKSDLNKIANLDESYIQYIPTDKESYAYIIQDTNKIKYKNLITKFCTEYEMIEDIETDKCIKEKTGAYAITYIIDNNTFKKYANKINANYENIKDKAILINTLPVEENKKTTYKELSNYKTNDEITLESINGNKKQTYQIGAVTEERTYGLEGQYSDALILVLNNDYIKEETEIERILINAKNPEEVGEKLKETENIYINNLASEVKSMKTMILILSIFIYGFITVVTLIGITSVFNTITSNMQLRQKDFATLKSIGMTKSEFNRMITLESLFYSFKSLVIGIILGLLGSYAIYKLLSRGIDFGYILPYKAIIISILFITIIVFIIMKYSINKVNKQNIIETIRRDNI